MHIDLIKTETEFLALSEEWNLLLQTSASHVPFLRHEFLFNWWKTLGGGEWPNGELFILTGRSSEGRLQGIAPLFATHNLAGDTALMLLGSIEIADYLDLIVSEQDLPDFIVSMFDYLETRPEAFSRCLDWYNLLESSPTIPVFLDQASRRGWQCEQQRLQPCPYIPLASDWETYLAGIDKKQRHEIRRKLRRADENPLPVDWYIAQDPDSLPAEIDAFFELMIQEPAKAAFLTDPMREQMKRSLQAAFDNGWLQLAFMTVAGERAAAYLNFDYDNHIWVYNSGYSLKYRDLSTGWVLLAHLIQWAIENRREEFDFLRGDEDYKYRFGGVERFVSRLIAKC